MLNGVLRDMNIRSGNTSALFVMRPLAGLFLTMPSLANARRQRLRRKTFNGGGAFSLLPSLQLVCVSDSPDDELDFLLDMVLITPLTPQL